MIYQVAAEFVADVEDMAVAEPQAVDGIVVAVRIVAGPGMAVVGVDQRNPRSIQDCRNSKQLQDPKTSQCDAVEAGHTVVDPDHLAEDTDPMLEVHVPLMLVGIPYSEHDWWPKSYQNPDVVELEDIGDTGSEDMALDQVVRT